MVNKISAGYVTSRIGDKKLSIPLKSNKEIKNEASVVPNKMKGK